MGSLIKCTTGSFPVSPLTVVAAVELCSERDAITPACRIDANPLRNNWHLEDVVSNIVTVRVAFEQLNEK